MILSYTILSINGISIKALVDLLVDLSSHRWVCKLVHVYAFTADFRFYLLTVDFTAAMQELQRISGRDETHTI